MALKAFNSENCETIEYITMEQIIDRYGHLLTKEDLIKIKEDWKDIPNYEGLYQASSFGRIKSLKRLVKNSGNRKTISYRNIRERILKTDTDKDGYLRVVLSKRSKRKTIKVQSLIAIVFHSHVRCGMEKVIDHIDNDKLNNHKDNLRIIDNRTNTNQQHLKSSSKFTGVDWHKASGKWHARIHINGKSKYLGLFINEEDAAEAYKKELNNHLKKKKLCL